MNATDANAFNSLMLRPETWRLIGLANELLFIFEFHPICVQCSIESFVNIRQNILHKTETCGFLVLR